MEAIERLRKARAKILEEFGKVIIGQSTVIDDMLTALFSRGHCLLVGVPGLAKTLMVKTLAATLHLAFKRIQFTPDLMPADITGTDVLEEDPVSRQRRFSFIKGPVFANVLLADEINRTPPKTQAALLEAMQEYRVTASGQSYDLPLPFFVLATQNPIEQEGTYPLPEAQLDRFMFNLLVDYPSREEEVAIVRATTLGEPSVPSPVLKSGDIIALQDLVRQLPVSSLVYYYAADLARATRPVDDRSPDFIKQYVSFGAGPRAAQYLTLGAKARAVLGGRVNVSLNDVRAVAANVFRHRIILNFNAHSDEVTPDRIVERLLEEVPEPEAKDLE
jgi:MoxR-like ATPase